MPRALTIVSLLPELLGTNGDAANARVLAQRARWAGLGADILPVRDTAELPEHADAVVIGSGSDADLVRALDILRPMAERLRTWVVAEVPVLAVGTGWELLGWGIEFGDGRVLEGLGITAGRAVPLAARATDDLVVTSKHGRLVGFENHARSHVGAEASALGLVQTGTGNGNGSEGLVMGSLIGTHLHGPVLARNPSLADRMLTSAANRLGVVYRGSARAEAVDETAKAARNQVAVRLGLDSE